MFLSQLNSSESTFQAKMTQFFSQCIESKNWVILTLKSWFTGRTKIRPNFLGQNDSIFFLSVHWEKKLSHFDLKSWVTGGIKIRPNFLGHNDSIFSISAPREKIESIDPKSWVTDGTKIWPNVLGQNDWHGVFYKGHLN